MGTLCSTAPKEGMVQERPGQQNNVSANAKQNSGSLPNEKKANLPISGDVSDIGTPVHHEEKVVELGNEKEDKIEEPNSHDDKNPIDISSISKEYLQAWSLGGEKLKQSRSPELQEALQKHYKKIKEDKEYADECNKERDEAFVLQDVNKNNMLDLDEYLKFCVQAGEMLTARIGVQFINVDEDTMKQHWELNRHEGKSGITLNDFHKKLEIDTKLMEWKRHEKKVEEVNQVHGITGQLEESKIELETTNENQQEKAQQEHEAEQERIRKEQEENEKAEAERKRIEQEESQRIAEKEAEQEKQKLEDEAEAEAEKKRLRLEEESEADKERIRLEEEAEAEKERQRIADEEAEKERLRIAEEEAEKERQLVEEQEAEKERQRIADEEAEQERLRLEEEAEQEKKKIADEETEQERLRLEEEEAEKDRERVKHEEEETARIAAEKAAEEEKKEEDDDKHESHEKTAETEETEENSEQKPSEELGAELEEGGDSKQETEAGSGKKKKKRKNKNKNK